MGSRPWLDFGARQWKQKERVAVGSILHTRKTWWLIA